MSVQDDKAADQDTDQPSDEDQHITEKPEPDEDDKRKAAEMMTAYEDRPTLVLPGTGGMVSGTAVNDWLDDEGNPKYNEEAAADVGSDDNESDKKAKKEQIEKDKAWNEELKKAAAQENKGEDH
jgi:hypothetical protein